MTSITFTHQQAFLQRLAGYWNVGGRLPFSSHDLACLQAVQTTLSDLIADDEEQSLVPTVEGACPCPDCAATILWTRWNGVRTAWAVHQCPPHEGDAL